MNDAQSISKLNEKNNLCSASRFCLGGALANQIHPWRVVERLFRDESVIVTPISQVIEKIYSHVTLYAILLFRP